LNNNTDLCRPCAPICGFLFLEKLHTVRQLDNSKRNRLFVYGQYMDILNA